MSERTPIMYELDRCPRCKAVTPLHVQELTEILFREHGWYNVEASDEWYCPDCSYCFLAEWRPEEVCWYDEEFLATIKAAQESTDAANENVPLKLFICCGDWFRYTCNCEQSYTFDDALETLFQVNLDPEDLYELREDNLDCSTCDLFAQNSCDPFVSSLSSFITSGQEGPSITICEDYQYNAADEQKYKLRKLTRDLMVTEVELVKSKKKETINQ